MTPVDSPYMFGAITNFASFKRASISFSFRKPTLYRTVLRRCYRTAYTIMFQHDSVFVTGCRLIRRSGIMAVKSAVQPDLRRNQELTILAVAGAAGMNLGKTSDILSRKVTGISAVRGIRAWVNRSVGPCRVDHRIPVVIHALSWVNKSRQIAQYGHGDTPFQMDDFFIFRTVFVVPAYYFILSNTHYRRFEGLQRFRVAVDHFHFSLDPNTGRLFRT